MLLGRKSTGLILAGVAAYAWYKYSKMNADEKRDLVNNLKEKGKRIFGSVISGTENAGAADGKAFSQGTQYAG
jgi:hypothetical protein